MTRVRALHLLGELRSSGAEVGLRDSAPLWDEMGVDITILSTGDQVGDFAEALRGAGYPVHHLAFEGHPRHPRAVRRLVHTGGHDLLHVHTERANVWYALEARRCRIPVVRTIHNTFPFEGWLRAKRTAQRWTSRRIGVQLVSVGPSVARNERTRFANPTRMIPNGIDMTRFRPLDPGRRAEVRGQLGVPADTPLVISVGNCNDIKNHPALLQGLARLPADQPWHYVHAGADDSDQVDRRLATELDIADRCSFVGTWPDVPGLQAAADVHAMPSLFEGTGNAAIEGLACGTTSVLSDVPGLSDLATIVSGGIGWVNARDVDSIAHGLLRAVRGEVPSPGPAQLHDEVAAAFGMRPYVEAHVEMYRSMLAGTSVTAAP